MRNKKINSTFDTVIHRWLRFPYTLNTTDFHSPKRPKATVVLIHGIGNSAKAWDELVPLLPDNVRVIGIDLLGFGGSPRPKWAKYSARTQAKALGVTLMGLRLTQQPIIVGHSLGSLVAVEVAKRYPFIVKQLVLCSPPFYATAIDNKKRSLQRDQMLRELYKTAKKHPEMLLSLTPMAVKLGFANAAFNLTHDNVDAYTSALEASIINQTSLDDAARLRIPTTILYGSLDPVVIGSHIKKLAQDNKHITARQLIVGHEVVGRYTKVLAKEITAIIDPTTVKK